MSDTIIIALVAAMVWAQVGLVALIIGVLKFSLHGSHRNCLIACLMGPLLMAAVIHAFITGDRSL